MIGLVAVVEDSVLPLELTGFGGEGVSSGSSSKSSSRAVVGDSRGASTFYYHQLIS